MYISSFTVDNYKFSSKGYKSQNINEVNKGWKFWLFVQLCILKWLYLYSYLFKTYSIFNLHTLFLYGYLLKKLFHYCFEVAKPLWSGWNLIKVYCTHQNPGFIIQFVAVCSWHFAIWRCWPQWNGSLPREVQLWHLHSQAQYLDQGL